MDMLGGMLRGMGIDPDALMGQAAALGAAFERIATAQAVVLERLETLQAGQDAISAAMGLYVAPPTEALLQIIAVESAKFTDVVAVQ